MLASTRPASHTCPMTKQRAHSAFATFDVPRPSVRACDHPDCEGEGSFRAPKDRNTLNDYYWFCLDHVREYNRAWDYYAGMNQTQIEAEMRRDTTWQRPSWPLGQWGKQEKFLRDRVVHGFSFEFGRDGGRTGADEQQQRRQAARTAEEEALVVLELTPPVDFPTIKKRYHALAKQHHPDANGGDKAAEERLKAINLAYNALKACYGV